MRLLGWIRDRFFPDVRSLFLWPLAVAWLVAIGGLGWELFQVRGRGLIVGGVLMAFEVFILVFFITYLVVMRRLFPEPVNFTIWGV